MSEIPHYLPIKLLENRGSGLQAIKLLEEPFSGIIYTYGKVELKEDKENDILRINFEYDILENSNPNLDLNQFEKYIGDILTELIHIGVRENNISYTGGVDENRTEDSVNSGS